MSKRKLNIGDRVRATEDIVGHKTEGEIGTICEINSSLYNETIIVNFDNDINGWGDKRWGIREGHGLLCHESELEKAEPKFKIGDRVRATKDTDDYMIKGEVGTICVVNILKGIGVNYIVEFDNDVNGFGNFDLDIPKGHGLWCDEDTLEKVEPKFKKGDRVRATKDIDGYKVKGEMGTIYEMDLQVYVVRFDNDINGSDGANLDIDEDYELICYESELEKIDTKFKVGDRVIGIADELEYYPTKGATGTVAEVYECGKQNILVTFDEPIVVNGEDFNDLYVHDSILELISPPIDTPWGDIEYRIGDLVRSTIDNTLGYVNGISIREGIVILELVSYLSNEVIHLVNADQVRLVGWLDR